MSKRSEPIPEPIHTAALQWLMRRDRGFSPAEQDEFLQWRSEDPRHAAAFAQHEATLHRMMQLGDWTPLVAPEPNPELFTGPRTSSRRMGPVGVLGAIAACLVVLFVLLWREGPAAGAQPEAPRTYLRVNERQALADGSIVELKDGSHLEVIYSSAERRVKLVGGEAHFTVTKDPERPFVVAAHGVAVRAVGTAFNVRLEPDAVEVLVTEGSVQVSKPAPALAADPRSPGEQSPTTLGAGQRSVVPLEAAAKPPEITVVSPAQMKAALAWQTPRLQFFETPLAEAVEEFNRHATGNLKRRIVLDGAALATVQIGGTFRVDNIDGFVRLLKYTMNVRVTERDTEIVLSPR